MQSKRKKSPRQQFSETFYGFYCYIYNEYSKIESLWQQLYFKGLP